MDKSVIMQEQNIIAFCFKKPEYILNVDDKFFITEEGKELFIILKNLYTGDKKITSRNVIIEVNKKKDLKIKDHQIENLFTLDIPLEPKDFDYYYNDLKSLWLQYNIQQNTLKEILKESSKKSDFDINEIKKLINLIDENIAIVNNDKIVEYYPQEMLNEYINLLYRRMNQQDFQSTGCNHLDSMLSEGFAPKLITIIFGPSGVGKSSFALHLVNRQINKFIPSIYLTLEMPYESTMDRLVAMRLRIPYAEFHPNTMYEENETIRQQVFDQIENEKRILKDHRYFKLVEKDALFIRDVEEIITRTKKEMKVDSIIVTIDLLTMLKDFNVGGKNKAEKYEDAMNLLHEVARRTNCHIVGVVQGRRPESRVNITEVDQLDRFRPNIEELKNSGALEERSRIVLGVFRRKHFAKRYIPNNPETELMDDIAEISVLKQNMGDLGEIKYLFDPLTYTFTKYIEEERAYCEEEEEHIG